MYRDFSDMKGLTLSHISINDDKNEMDFTTLEGRKFRLYHERDCCECVGIEEIHGDLTDLLNNPLLECEEISNEGLNVLMGLDDCPDVSCTWTFYKLGTIKGCVTIRWLGTSNGYYSESVEFKEL